jgi:hypothetical protein
MPKLSRETPHTEDFYRARRYRPQTSAFDTYYFYQSDLTGALVVLTRGREKQSGVRVWWVQYVAPAGAPEPPPLMLDYYLCEPYEWDGPFKTRAEAGKAGAFSGLGALRTHDEAQGAAVPRLSSRSRPAPRVQVRQSSGADRC